MIITCEACGTNYKIKSSLISQNGSTVKCSRCQHIFVAYPPSKETQKSHKTRPDTEVTSADYPQPGTSTFFEDAAETEKKLDALFSEEPESKEPWFEDIPETGGEAGGPESAAEEEPPFDYSEYQSDVGLSGLEYEPEDVFADDFESPAEEIKLSDLEYDADLAEEINLSDLEYDEDLELADLEEEPVEMADFEPDLVEPEDPEPEPVNLADLEAPEPEPVNLADLETIQALQTGGKESRPSAETTQETLGEEFVFDLQQEEEELEDLSIGLDQSELEAEPGKESDGLGYEADEDLSDFEYGLEDVFADDFESPAEEINLSDLEYDADLEPADLEEEPVEMGDLESDFAEPEDLEPEPVNLADLEAPEPEPVELKHLESEVVGLEDLEPEPVDLADLEAVGPEAVEQEDMEPEPLDLTDLEAEPAAEAIDLASGQGGSDDEEADFFDFETGAEEAEAKKETTQEEFDLDLDLDLDWDDEEETEFDLDLEEIDFDLETGKTTAEDFGTEKTMALDIDFETQEAGEKTRPEPETKPDKEIRPPEPEPEAGAETESGEESFELDLDFEEPEEAESEEAASGEGETFELGLEEERSLEEEGGEEPFEFDLGLEEEAGAEAGKEAGDKDRMEPDLDFEETPEEPSEEKAGAEDESEEIELELEFDTPETGQEHAGSAGEKQEEHGEEELDLTDVEDFLEETGETDMEDTDSQEAAEFDLDLETVAESGSTGGDEDFDIDLSTMIDETFEEEPESEKDVSLEPVESEKEEEPEPEPGAKQYRESGAGREDETQFAAVFPPGAKEADTAPPEAAAPSPAGGKGRSKKLPALIAAIILLGLIGGGAYFYYTQQIAPSTVQDSGNVNLDVSTPDYGFVNNANAGRLLVVTGRVINRYDHARGNILVRANLLDSGGNRIKRAAAYCGNMFTPNQLKTLEMQSINQRLSRSRGEGGANSSVGPGQSIPFTVVLSDLPQNMASLKVEAVSSEKAR